MILRKWKTPGSRSGAVGCEIHWAVHLFLGEALSGLWQKVAGETESVALSSAPIAQSRKVLADHLVRSRFMKKSLSWECRGFSDPGAVRSLELFDSAAARSRAPFGSSLSVPSAGTQLPVAHEPQGSRATPFRAV